MNTACFICKNIPNTSHSREAGTSLFLKEINHIEDLTGINLEYIHNESVYRNPSQWSLCFNLTSDNTSHSKLLKDLFEKKNTLLQLLFHPTFYRTAQNKQFFFAIDETTPHETFLAIDNLVEYLSGDPPFEVQTFFFSNAPDHDATVQSNPIFTGEQDFEEWYYTLLANKKQWGYWIGAPISDPAEIPKLSAKQRQAEEKFLASEPSLYRLYSQMKDILQQQEEKDLELAAVKEDLKNQKKYLETIRLQDEAQKINTFYHYEYEVLPGWFKRIGHIVKVIYGKRSFKSLFNDNVEKYRK